MVELYHRRFVLLLGVSLAAAVFTAPLTALLPAYVEEQLDLLPRFTGLLAAAQMSVAAALFPIGGALADHVGYKRTLILGLTGGAVSGLVFLVSSSPLLVTAAAVIGAGFALQTVGGQSYLLRVTHGSRLGIGAALFFIGSTLGGSLGSLAIGPMADRWGYRAMGGVMFGGMMMVIVVALLFLPAVPLPDVSRRRTWRSGFAGYGDLLRRSQVRWLLAVRFLPTFTWGMAIVAFPYLLFVHTGTERQPAFYTAASLAVAAAAQVVTGQMVDRFGVLWPMRMTPICLVLSCGCAAIWVDSLFGLWVFGIAMTASVWSLSTTMPALMSTMSTEHEKGRIVGAAHVAWALGMALGGISAGWLLELDRSVCYQAGFIFSVATVMCAWHVTRRQ